MMEFGAWLQFLEIFCLDSTYTMYHTIQCIYIYSITMNSLPTIAEIGGASIFLCSSG